MTTIIGVDYSGAVADRNTWMTESLLEGAVLTIQNCRRIRRQCLTEFLAGLQDDEVVIGMDFPFGVPRGLLEFLHIQAHEMPVVWAAFADVTPEVLWRQATDLRANRRANRQRPVEIGRVADGVHALALSAVNLRMYRMTLRGMQMLHHLYVANPNRWNVPPLDQPPHPERTVTLLELMPGSLLLNIGFERDIARAYKGQRPGRRENRVFILDNLPGNVQPLGINLVIPDNIRAMCLDNDDCLDSVIAAVGAAAWALNPAIFRHPTDDELADAQLEGWIYVPNAQDV